eukprot:COSAG01_NODE_62566_length_284_cov_0.464865_1_plen_73_part_01
MLLFLLFLPLLLFLLLLLVPLFKPTALLPHISQLAVVRRAQLQFRIAPLHLHLLLPPPPTLLTTPLINRRNHH